MAFSENVTKVAEVLAQLIFVRLYFCPINSPSAARPDSAKGTFHNPRRIAEEDCFLFVFRTQNGK